MGDLLYFIPALEGESTLSSVNLTLRSVSELLCFSAPFIVMRYPAVPGTF